MSTLKTVVTDQDPLQYFDTLTIPRREESMALNTMLMRISNHPPKMWGQSLIGYGSYDYRYASGRTGTWFRIAFSPRKPALVIYIIPGFAEFEAQLNELGPYKHEKSCLYIKALDKIKMPVLEALALKSLRLMGEKYPET